MAVHFCTSNPCAICMGFGITGRAGFGMAGSPGLSDADVERIATKVADKLQAAKMDGREITNIVNAYRRCQA